MPVLNPNVAAMDVDSEQLHLSIAGDTPVVFGTFTEEVYRRRDYLKAQGVTSAAIRRLQDFQRLHIKFHDVISGLDGLSGLNVVRAILAGERDPQALLLLCDPQIQKRKGERVVQSLKGTWAPERLFGLGQSNLPEGGPGYRDRAVTGLCRATVTWSRLRPPPLNPDLSSP